MDEPKEEEEPIMPAIATKPAFVSTVSAFTTKFHAWIKPARRKIAFFSKPLRVRIEAFAAFSSHLFRILRV